VPWPEMMITSGGFTSSRTFCKVSSPSMPGSQISSRTTSNGLFWIASRHASPLAAAATVWPSSSNTPCRDSRIAASSSTMRMLSMRNLDRLCGGIAGEWKLKYKAGAYRFVLLDPNRTMVFFHDAAHDRQAETSATFLRREVGQEQLLL